MRGRAVAAFTVLLRLQPWIFPQVKFNLLLVTQNQPCSISDLNGVSISCNPEALTNADRFQTSKAICRVPTSPPVSLNWGIAGKL